MNINKLWGHTKTITSHKIEVMRLCFKCGLYKQGLLHDLSKYAPEEFLAGVRYYQGHCSPITAEKRELGYSLAWLHHKGRNKHHYEYWYDRDPETRQMTYGHMPFNYMLESVLDRIAASKVYNGSRYGDALPLSFLNNSSDVLCMGNENYPRIAALLKYLEDNGEEKALKYYSELYHQWQKDHDFDI